MKTTQEFIDTLVKIELIDGGDYGHYPFQMVAENAKGELTVAALCLGGDVVSVYKTAKVQLMNGAVKLFISIDFPANLDIKHDFVAVYTLIDNQLECIAIPYEPTTGQQFPEVISGVMIDLLKIRFTNHVLN